MAYMTQPRPLGFTTWTCGCGRLGLALALDACPECDAPQPGAAPAAVPAAAVPRSRSTGGSQARAAAQEHSEGA